MKKKLQSALNFYNYICKQNPEYKSLYSIALIGDIKRIIK